VPAHFAADAGLFENVDRLWGYTNNARQLASITTPDQARKIVAVDTNFFLGAGCLVP
jgi:hypothetical protein